jgi:hypothetical protein
MGVQLGEYVTTISNRKITMRSHTSMCRTINFNCFILNLFYDTYIYHIV